MKYGDQPDRFMDSEVGGAALWCSCGCVLCSVAVCCSAQPDRFTDSEVGGPALWCAGLASCAGPACRSAAHRAAHSMPTWHPQAPPQADLDEAVKAMLVVASAPDLYPELVRG